MEALRTRLDATERRLQEANEILQAQIAECKRGEETSEKAQKYAESIVETIREPLIVLTPMKVSLNILRFHHILRPNESFHASLLFSPVDLIPCY